MIIELEGITGAEESTNLSVTLVPTSWVVMVRLKGARAAGLGIQLTAQKSIDNQHRAGWLFPAEVVPFGFPHSWGMTMTSRANVERREADDRTVRVTKRGEVQRTVRIGWVDGLETGRLDQTPASTSAGLDLDYLAIDGGVPVATHDDVAYLWEGLLRDVDGALRPLGLCHRVEDFDTVTVLSRLREFLIVRLSSEVQIDEIVGDQLVDVLTRMSPLVGEEVK